MATKFIQRRPGGPPASTGDAVGIAVDANDDILKIRVGGVLQQFATSTPINLATQTSGKLDLTTQVNGVLPVANGGTGTATALAVGATADYAKTTAGAQTLLAANASASRTVMITAEVTEEFANGSGAQTVFSIGVTGATTQFAATTVFLNATVGTRFSFGGTIAATKALLVTGTAATGTGTGALKITAIAVQ